MFTRLQIPCFTRKRFDVITGFFAETVDLAQSADEEAIVHMVNGRGDVRKDYEEGAWIEFDEQHSRPQCHGSQAPYATCTFIDQESRKIIVQGHADKNICKNVGCLSKEKASRNCGMYHLMERVNRIKAFVSDESSGAAKSITTFKAHFPQHRAVEHYYDVWHKQRKLGTAFIKLQNERLKKYGDWKYPRLRNIKVAKVKRHFDFSCDYALGDPEAFEGQLLAILSHYCDTRVLHVDSPSYGAFRALLEKTAQGANRYVYGCRTADCESFHALANKYCPKGLNQSFEMYVCRKQLARLHWNCMMESHEAVASMKKKIFDVTLLLYFTK